MASDRFTRRGSEGRFPDEVKTETWVATITVEIEQKAHNDWRPVRDRGVTVVAERAVSAASLAYNFHDARIIEASLVSLDPVPAAPEGGAE